MSTQKPEQMYQVGGSPPIGRVAHIYNFLHPRRGGPPQVIMQLARAQLAAGYSVRLIAEDIDDPEVRRALCDTLCDTLCDPRALTTPTLPQGLELMRLGSKRGLLLSRLPFERARAPLDALLEGVQVAHMHSIWPPQCAALSARCRDLGIPYVLTLHGHLRPEALAIKPLKKRLAFLALGYADMLHGAARVQALSEGEREEAEAWGVRAPVSVIPNGAPLEALRAPVERAALNEALPTLGGAPFLLFLSRIHPPKGTLDLARAFIRLAPRHPELRLVVAGVDEGGGQGQMEAALREAGLLERAHFPGFLTGRAKSAALQHATAFCLPSYHEGFSVAALEALAAGAPTVLARGCRFPEAAAAGVSWEHENGVEGLVGALEDVLARPQESRERGRRAQAWVASRYTWAQVSAQLSALYAALNPALSPRS